MIVLDTNVISELMRPEPSSGDNDFEDEERGHEAEKVEPL